MTGTDHSIRRACGGRPTGPTFRMRGLVAFAAIAVISGCATTPPPSVALSSSALLRPTSDKSKPYAYRRADVNFAAYGRVLVPPTEIYAGPDAQFGKMSAADRQALAVYMHQEFSRVLGRRLQIAGQPGPGTLRARLTLTGAEASTPVLSTVSHVLPVGLVVNAGAQATGGRGTFSGWSPTPSRSRTPIPALCSMPMSPTGAPTRSTSPPISGRSTRQRRACARQPTSWTRSSPAQRDNDNGRPIRFAGWPRTRAKRATIGLADRLLPFHADPAHPSL